ncbi:hypothetical protein FRC03_007381 [Tulasnella sp. 419]|nr:hypothetical protein FRC03_007381 [Tulasnella sp. 419]
MSLHLTMPTATTTAKMAAIITPPHTPPSKQAWYVVAAQKQADRDKILQRYAQWRIPPVPSSVLDVSPLLFHHLTPKERDIVNMDATDLVRSIKERIYSAVEVLTAFVKVTIAAQDTTNCVTEIFFEEGFARARQLDDHLIRTGNVVGPLHGLPVSIKDHILVNGFDTSTGYISWANERTATKDAVVVDILRKAGAVLYVKTANPQTLLCLETNNNIYGRTVNPFNRNLSPGGSSGGEGALIAARGSPMGVGTDIGGSIRVPAGFSGIYGLKASVARMPHAGLLGSHDGMDNIVGVVGPLAQSARDLELFSRVMLQYEAWTLEHAVLEIPWNEALAREGRGLPEKLCVAVLWDDHVVRPHPPIVKEMRRVANALKQAGHEVVDWQPLEHQQGWDLIAKLYLLDSGAEYHQTLAESGEPAVPGTSWILQQSPTTPLTIPDTWKLNLEREAFRARALRHWNETKLRTKSERPVDCILSPVHATLAVPHDGVRWWGYSSHWNILDLPGVVFPSGGRLRSEDWEGVGFEGGAPRNQVEAEVMEQWDPKTYQGAPISLQLVGRRHNEEKLLAMLRVVEDSVKNAA